VPPNWVEVSSVVHFRASASITEESPKSVRHAIPHWLTRTLSFWDDSTWEDLVAFRAMSMRNSLLWDHHAQCYYHVGTSILLQYGIPDIMMSSRLFTMPSNPVTYEISPWRGGIRFEVFSDIPLFHPRWHQADTA
jgi:hypothetical protein